MTSTIIKKGLFSGYIDLLKSNTPTNDTIIKIDFNSNIECKFNYIKGNEAIEGLIYMPWILGIKTKKGMDYEYFPESIIKGLLILFITKFFSYTSDIQETPTINNKDIIEDLVSGNFPEIKDFKNVEILDFRPIKN